jgi:hypothetical protein
MVDDKTSPGQRRQRRIAEPEEATYSRAEHDKPDSVHGSLRVSVDLLPPSRPGERIIARECKDNARGIYALCCASDELQELSLPSYAGSSLLTRILSPVRQ